MKHLTRLAMGLSLAVAALAGGPALADVPGATYNVTITNLTRGQIISPPILFSHQSGFQLFKLGAPASAELTKLAEDGMTADLATYLGSQSAVYDVVTATGPILPGASLTLQVKARLGARFVSAAGMLVTTNDGFFAIRGEPVPLLGSSVVEAEAYDAGTETNSENCLYIPGPPCGNGGVRDTADAEGYVHVHAGIHGIGDLDPAQHDWRNPVAEITIQRAR